MFPCHIQQVKKQKHWNNLHAKTTEKIDDNISANGQQRLRRIYGNKTYELRCDVPLKEVNIYSRDDGIINVILVQLNLPIKREQSTNLQMA